MTVERYLLGGNVEIARAITGLWQIADMEKDGTTLDPVKTAEFMAPYAKAGLTTFDMADHYGSAEIIAGTFKNSSDLGKSCTMLTKWVPKTGAITRADVREAIAERLERLQTDQVELLQYHAWKFSHPSWLDALLYLQELKEEGLIKALGTTNFDTAHLRIAKSSGIDIVSNQISYSLIDRRGGGQMANYCEANGIGILAYGTLAGGFLSNRWLGKAEPSPQKLSTWSQMKYKRFIDAAGGWERFQNLLRTLDEIAKEISAGLASDKSISIATLASKYQLEQRAVAGVIIGARLGENAHFEDTVKLFEFSFTKSQLARIDEAVNLLLPIRGDCGDEYRKPPYLTASGDLSHHLDEFPPAYQPINEGIKVRAESGTVWEEIAGYSRAVRVKDRVMVSGTTATHGSIAIGGNDPAAQTHFIIDKIEASLESLGAKLSDVVRTRIYLSSIDIWEPVSRAHGERFAETRPANTMVEAKLIGDQYLVEIEAEALIQ